MTKITKKSYAQTMTVEDALDQYSRAMAYDMEALFKSQELGADVARLFVLSSVREMVRVLIVNALENIPKNLTSKQDRYEHAYSNFSEVKADVSDYVAQGFQKAFKLWSGVDTEYYCQIKTMPQPDHKEPM